MKHIRIATTAALALSLPVLAGTAAVAAPAASPPAPAVAQAAVTAPADLASARAVILDETNAARAAAGLAPVTEDADLDAVAQGCSETQAANGVMAHCEGYYTRYPAGWTRASENVASGQSVADVVDAWLASPGHRANILDPAATHLGIGYALGADGRTYFTQNFAAYPAGSRPEPAPEPAPAPAPAPEPVPAPEPAPAPAPEPVPAPEPAPAPPAVDVPSMPEVDVPSVPDVDVPTAAEIRELVWAHLRESGYPWVDAEALQQQIRDGLAAAGVAADLTIADYLP
jgi:uncharacterized protein YkwD